MRVIKGKRLEGVAIQLDGIDWQDCTFSSCRLAYAAGPLGWSGNTTVNCVFIPLGGATMALLLADSIPVAEGGQVEEYLSPDDLE